MTEEEWLRCDRLSSLAPYLPESQSDRKLRLFACACCYQIWPMLVDKRSRLAVEVAQLFAEGKISRGKLAEVAFAAQEAIDEGESQPDRFARTAAAHAASHMQVAAQTIQVYWFRTTAGNAMYAVTSKIEEWY